MNDVLLLCVQSFRNQPLADAPQVRLGPDGGILGRAPGNDLVLDDPSKFISRIHARVSWRDGRYYLADEGVNPSIVDDRPLGSGLQAALDDGSRIVIGDYALVATLERAPAAVPESDATTLQPAPLAAPPQDDFLAGARILDSRADASDGADPLGLNLFAGLAPVAAPAGRQVAPPYRGTESDHAAPHLQVFALPVAPAIPDGYDPLADLLPAAVPAQLMAAPPAAPAPPVEPAPPARLAPLPEAGGDAVLAALLDGLGLPQLQPAQAPEAFAREAGRMLRAAVGGTIDVLMARALTKRESRIDLTMIAPRANNPLKFFPDADTALTQMLGARLPGYMAPLEALEGAFDDLKAHELAVIAGMRAALAAVARRFDPARIEARLAEPGRLDRLLPAARKARLWDRLVETHAELARDADEDLQRLFGEKFSSAYEEQVERLRRECA